jgi:glycosyltransferase involved in cell wall biosynthesis
LAKSSFYETVFSVAKQLSSNTNNSTMRIAYLINQYPKISHSFIRREILALERQGFEVVRIAIRGWEGETVDAEDRFELTRTRYVLRGGPPALLLAVVCTLFRRPVSLIQTLALTYRMGRRAERPLLVHLVYLAEACRIEPWLRKTGVQHLHAHFGTNSAEVAMLVHALGGPEWSFTVHGPEEFDKPQFIGLSEKIRRCSFVIAVSSYTRSQLYRWSDLRHWPKVQVVHCGLEAKNFAGPAISVPTTRRLVCVGRLCEQKGQLILIEAAHLLKLRGVDFELVLAGDGEMRDAIEALVFRYELQGRVRITGWIAGEQVRDEILSARALVLPSFAEGLPVAVMEAMALSRPVITTFVAGIPELVQEGEHGWLVPSGDVEALMHAMQVCLDTPVNTLNLMGEAARKRVITNHNIDTEAAALAKLFNASFEKRRNLSNDESLDKDSRADSKPIPLPEASK